MDIEDAHEELEEVRQLIRIANRKLVAVAKVHNEKSAYLKDPCVSLNSAEMLLGLAQDDIAELIE